VAATPGHHGGGCGIFGQIILAVVAVAMAVLTFNPVVGILTSTLGSAGAAVACGECTDCAHLWECKSFFSAHTLPSGAVPDNLKNEVFWEK